MEQSIALVIYKESDLEKVREELQIIKNSLYNMDMKIAVILNGRSRDIKQAIQQITDMKPSEIMSILCIIRAPLDHQDDRLFETADGKLDVYNDIINPFNLYEFRKKHKIIITNGSYVQLDSNDGEENQPSAAGDNILLLASPNTDFTRKFLHILAKKKGNCNKAIETHIKENKYSPKRTSTATKLKVKIPKIKSSDHEFSVN